VSQFSDIIKEFIEKSNRPMLFGALPVRATNPEAPVVPMDRWHEADGALYKTYRFRVPEWRDSFVSALLNYEREVQHNAQIRIDEGEVSLRVQTRTAERVTELDKEYARFADVVFKDLVSRPDVVVSSDAELDLAGEVGSDDDDRDQGGDF
jgi:pterin-4a-carbinolamine dehydratase